MTCQPTRFLLEWKGVDGSFTEKKLTADGNAIRAKANKSIKMCEIHPVFCHPAFLVGRHRELIGSPSTTGKGGWRKTAHYITLAVTKLFQQDHKLVLCHGHPASSSICQQSQCRYIVHVINSNQGHAIYFVTFGELRMQWFYLTILRHFTCWIIDFSIMCQ